MGRILTLYLFLLALVLPFAYPLLPFPGRMICDLIEPYLNDIGSWIIPDCLSCNWSISSDSAGLFILALFIIPIAFLLEFILAKTKSLPELNTWKGLQFLLLLFLFMHLLRYGLDKVLLRQFGAPEANLLFSPLGMMKKDMLFWSLMGSSPFYSVLTGCIEALAAILMIIPRTRPMGLIMATLIMAHVFLLNMSFEIDVLFFSGLLLSISLLLSWRIWSKVISAVLGNSGKLDSAPAQKESTLVIKSTKAMLILAILADVLLPLITSESYQSQKPIELKSAYQSHSKGMTKLFFHSTGHLIWQDEEAKFHTEKVIFNKNEGGFYLQDQGTFISYTIHQDTLIIKGLIDASALVFTAIDLKQLPLLQ